MFYVVLQGFGILMWYFWGICSKFINNSWENFTPNLCNKSDQPNNYWDIIEHLKVHYIHHVVLSTLNLQHINRCLTEMQFMTQKTWHTVLRLIFRLRFWVLSVCFLSFGLVCVFFVCFFLRCSCARPHTCPASASLAIEGPFLLNGPTCSALKTPNYTKKRQKWVYDESLTVK